MERLTYKTTNIQTGDVLAYGLNSGCNMMLKGIQKLGAYEDAEEQGMILRLPCKVGDKVFYVDSIRKFVDECEIRRIKCESLDERHMGITLEMIGSLWHCVRAELIGNDIFLTKEEAEKELERLNGNGEKL